MLHRGFKTFAKYSGFITVGLEWFALIAFYFANPSYFSELRPISYFAVQPQTHTIYAICYGLAAISFWIFIVANVRHHYKTPTLLFSLSMIALLEIALGQFNPDDIHSVVRHEYIAAFMALALLLGIGWMAIRNDDLRLRKLSAVVFVLGAILSLAIWFDDGSTSKTIIFNEIFASMLAQLWVIMLSLSILQKDIDDTKAKLPKNTIMRSASSE